MTPVQVALPVDKYREGRRTRVRLLALHTTEGARTMGSLAAFLRRGPQSSYHAGTDDQALAYLVNRRHEAWHCRNANPMADGFVFCGFARWSRTEWFEHPVMLENAAWWLASCARERGLPLRWLSVPEVGAAVRDPNHPGGVMDHDDYSDATGDGSHWDCGEGLPKDWLIDRARQIHQGQITKEDDVALTDADIDKIAHRISNWHFAPGPTYVGVDRNWVQSLETRDGVRALIADVAGLQAAVAQLAAAGADDLNADELVTRFAAAARAALADAVINVDVDVTTPTP